ncbi:MAG: hypothetical protein H7070_08360, partial [Saprospiraceae bacterium]|nr:hypothetical protein [Pyrinomonadaceae bacterium]
MTHKLYIDATDLVHWSDRTESQSQLPNLVRSLIIGTVPKINHIGIAAGEGVALPGYDGVLDVDAGNAWVPDGASVWEMGTTKDKKGKADGDYEKRKGEPGDEVDPSETTFVFVTSRRWREKEKNEW